MNIKKFINKRQLILVGLLAVVGVAGYFNWSYQNNNGEAPSTDATLPIAYEDAREVGTTPQKDADTSINNDIKEPNFFDKTRQDREKSRDEALEIYKENLQNKSSSQDAKKNAETAIAKIAKSREIESNIESLIKAKGFEDVVVCVDEKVDIMVKGKNLLPAQVAQIRDIVIDKAKVTVDDIKIVEAE